VARAHGAVCTPDFFGYDKERKLRYAEVDDLTRRGIKPGLAVVLVGEDPANQVTCAARPHRRLRPAWHRHRPVSVATNSQP
jgi:hypothetical protein